MACSLKKETNSQIYRTNLCKQLLDTSLDSRRVGATDHVDLLAVLEEEEGGHSRDLVVGSDLAELVNIHLVELDASVLLAHLLNSGGDGLAGTAPLSEEVDEDGLGGVGNLGLEVLLAVTRALSADALENRTKGRGKDIRSDLNDVATHFEG